MPYKTGRRVRKSKKPMKKKNKGVRRAKKGDTNTTQVFSETYKCGTECAGVTLDGEMVIPSGQLGAGFNLITQLNKLQQISN